MRAASRCAQLSTRSTLWAIGRRPHSVTRSCHSGKLACATSHKIQIAQPSPLPLQRLHRALVLMASCQPFGTHVDRTGTYARKLQGRGGEYIGKDVVPLWIADMDFEAPAPIVEAMVIRAKHGVYGYSDPPPELAELTAARLHTVYGCKSADTSWIRWQPGLACGLTHAVRACCASSSDLVAVATPIYPPFLSLVEVGGATVLPVPLAEARDGEAKLRYEIDWVAMESALSKPETKLLLWCNPHNPTGRCWSASDMRRLSQMCVTHDVTLCSDEVWGELVLTPDRAPFCSGLSLLAACNHGDGANTAAESTPSSGAASYEADQSAGTSVRGLAERLIVLSSPSKAFNVASLDLAFAVIPDAQLRKRFIAVGRDQAEIPPFGIVAAIAAYGDARCEEWRQQLVEYINGNYEHAAAVLSQVEGVRLTRPEASYLVWMDVRDALPPSARDSDAAAFLVDAGVGLSGGKAFGVAGTGYVRMNLASPRDTLSLGLQRIVAALSNP
uniref:cysteine-S-conjugate beta-lyase n=1 Tax=Chrysotila carterae TaxID=13221 RepID=A0A7S4BMC5_CHRCT|mmetsp:Transcript_11588/g.24850  ORF Transcript_11588/g.24850 Transcript_11588/m.24850 type:complete len:500 (+) Transcript_11588:53-1552(+)